MAIRRASDLPPSEGTSRSDRGERRRTRKDSDPTTAPETTRPRRTPIDQMPREEQVEQAKNSALNTLSMVAKTRGELETRLSTKGFPDDVIAEALDRLEEVGLVNDAAYADGYAASRQRSRGLTAGAIRRELQRKKLATEIIEAALTQISDEDEKAKAVELVERKAPSTRNLDTQTRIRRLAGMLIRKGYSPGLAFSVVKAILALEGQDVDDITDVEAP